MRDSFDLRLLDLNILEVLGRCQAQTHMGQETPVTLATPVYSLSPVLSSLTGGIERRQDRLWVHRQDAGSGHLGTQEHLKPAEMKEEAGGRILSRQGAYLSPLDHHSLCPILLQDTRSLVFPFSSSSPVRVSLSLS